LYRDRGKIEQGEGGHTKGCLWVTDNSYEKIGGKGEERLAKDRPGKNARGTKGTFDF